MATEIILLWGRNFIYRVFILSCNWTRKFYGIKRLRLPGIYSTKRLFNEKRQVELHEKTDSIFLADTGSCDSCRAHEYNWMDTLCNVDYFTLQSVKVRPAYSCSIPVSVDCFTSPSNAIKRNICVQCLSTGRYFKDRLANSLCSLDISGHSGSSLYTASNNHCAYHEHDNQQCGRTFTQREDKMEMRAFKLGVTISMTVEWGDM
jgi:hypothetical protein